jgi:flavin-dependent dehydrogenase
MSHSVIVGRDLEIGGVAFGYGPRRDVLDKTLVDAAIDAGAELREKFSVQEIVIDRDWSPADRAAITMAALR